MRRRGESEDCLICGKLEENVRTMMGCFVEVCRRRGLKVNVGKSKVMMLNGGGFRRGGLIV